MRQTVSLTAGEGHLLKLFLQARARRLRVLSDVKTPTPAQIAELPGSPVEIDPEQEAAIRQAQLARERREAVERACLPYVPLVIRMARQYEALAHAAKLGLMDLIQEGYLGLVKAWARFDPKRGVQFKTLARWWIRANITKVIEMGSAGTKGVRIPGGRADAIRNLRKTVELMTHRVGGQPTRAQVVAELVEKFDQDPDLAQKLFVYASYGALSIHDAEQSRGEEEATGRALEVQLQSQDPDSEALVMSSSDLRLLHIAFQTLDPRSQHILCLRHGLYGHQVHTQKDIGAIFGVCKERVRQITLDAEQLLQISFWRAKRTPRARRP